MCDPEDSEDPKAPRGGRDGSGSFPVRGFRVRRIAFDPATVSNKGSRSAFRSSSYPELSPRLCASALVLSRMRSQPKFVVHTYLGEGTPL